MMKRSESAIITLIAVLAMYAILVTSATAFSPNEKSPNPIPGVGIIVRSKPPKGAARTTQTDAEGNFTVSGLQDGKYSVQLKCKKCQSIDIGDALIEVTLHDNTYGTTKRTITKKQLVSGVAFTFEIAGEGGGQLTGHATVKKIFRSIKSLTANNRACWRELIRARNEKPARAFAGNRTSVSLSSSSATRSIAVKSGLAP